MQQLHAHNWWPVRRQRQDQGQDFWFDSGLAFLHQVSGDLFLGQRWGTVGCGKQSGEEAAPASCFLLPAGTACGTRRNTGSKEMLHQSRLPIMELGVKEMDMGGDMYSILHKQRLQLLSWHPSPEQDINMYQSKWGQCLSYFSHPSARDLVADPLAACISSAHEASHWAGCWEWASCSKPCGVQPASPFSAVILALAACTQELYTYAWDVMNKCFSSKGHT